MPTVFGTFDPLAVARPLSWVVVAAFLAAGFLADRDRERARGLGVLAWGLFAAFWLVLIPHFVVTQRSIVEGVGTVAAVPLSAYAGYVLWQGRDSLFVLTRAIGVMGLLYLPFAYVPFLPANPIRGFAIELVAAQTETLLGLVGVEPDLIRGVEYFDEVSNSDYQYRGTFLFPGDSQPITYTIIVACTGVGSMSIIAGLVAAVSAPWRRKVRALAVALPVIYVLNLLRNVFIATMFGQQRMQWFVDPVMTAFGLSDPQLVSYYIADRMLAQVGSVVALAVVTWLVVRELPEVLAVVDDVLYLVTGSEYDLREALDVPAARADGGESGD
ncbi:MAG: archaeosortase A [Haloarculaceae archaeon]